MKSGAFADVLTGVAKLMDAANASEAVEAVCLSLKEVFDVRPNLPVVRVLEQISHAEGRRTGGDEAVFEFLSCRDALTDLAQTMAQKSAAADFTLLFNWMEERREQSLVALVQDAVSILQEKERRAAAPEVQRELVAHYLRRLQDAVKGERRVEQIVAELSSDSSIRCGEVREIARAFAGAKGKSKREALARIAARQAAERERRLERVA